MDKFSKIIKNVVLFLAFFLIIQYIVSSCQNKEQDLLINSGNILFTTTDNEYSRRDTITVKIGNYTDQDVIIPNECPDEPFTVLRKENNEWVQKTATPDIECPDIEQFTIKPNEEEKIPYKSWNHALFSEMGQYKISFTTEIDGEEKTFETNEFLVTKEGVFSQLWVGVFYRPIYNALIFFTSIIPGHSLGLAIILLTIIIRTILLIPSQRAMKAQRKMQEIQPRLEKIKEKYKGDQQKIASETMALWKEAKANPLGSCLPLLLQLPFLLAIFRVVQDGLNPDNAYLLYAQYTNFSISDINVIFLGLLDLTKINIYVLPLVIGGLQFVQMKLSMARKTAKKKDESKKKDEMAMATNMMTYFMPVMIAAFTATLPAGIGIYWGTSTIYGIIQQIFVNKIVSKESDKEKSSVRVISREPKQSD